MKPQVTGAPRPGFLIVLALAGVGAYFHYHERSASAAEGGDGTWASSAPVAHTASVPYFLEPNNLAFTLGEAQTVGVCIYDMEGMLVRRFPAAMYPSGTQALAWDGLDDHGREADRGFYFARFDFAGTWSLRRLLWVGGP